jgi:hypothetical protein
VVYDDDEDQLRVSESDGNSEKQNCSVIIHLTKPQPGQKQSKSKGEKHAVKPGCNDNNTRVPLIQIHFLTATGKRSKTFN